MLPFSILDSDIGRVLSFAEALEELSVRSDQFVHDRLGLAWLYKSRYLQKTVGAVAGE